MLLMGLVSEDIATALEPYERKPEEMWKYLKKEFDKVTPELKQLAKPRLNSFKVNETLTSRRIFCRSSEHANISSTMSFRRIK